MRLGIVRSTGAHIILRSVTRFFYLKIEILLFKLFVSIRISGSKIYTVGGYKHEDALGLSNPSVDYFHTGKKRWFHAFSLLQGVYYDVDCCTLSVPVNVTKDFKPVSYPKHWVFW